MAVYTLLNDAEITRLLAEYDLPTLARAEGIRAGVSNTNYRLTLADGSQRILTLFEDKADAEDLPFFLGLMEHAERGGVPCPLPERAKDGALTRQLKGKPAALVTFLPGKSATLLRNVHLAELGAHLARFHLATADFPLARANALGLAGWERLAARVAPKADAIQPGLAEEVTQALGAIRADWPIDLPQGVIHADAFPDNIFYDAQDRLSGIIDFYFACNDFWAYELAILLNAWCFETGGEFNITKAQHLLRAYHATRPLQEAELEALPRLARGAALRFFLTRASAQLFPAKGALVTPKDPLEYVKKLRFHAQVKHHKEYGL